MLVGLRWGIGGTLRAYLVPRGGGGTATAAVDTSTSLLPSCAKVLEGFSCCSRPLLSTACYVYFSSGRETTVIEKNLARATLRSSTEFIVVKNADVDDDADGAVMGPNKKGMSRPASKKTKTTKKAPPPPATVLEEHRGCQ